MTEAGCFLRNRIYADPLCFECRKNYQSSPAYFILEDVKVYSQYVYEDDLRFALLRYKERLDQLLACMFLHPYWAFKFRKYHALLVPSTQGAVEKRGFHHVDLIARTSGFNRIITDVLVHEGKKEQALKKYDERKSVESEIVIQNSDLIKNKKILIIDDIVTSGQTLRKCIKLVKAHTDCVCVMTVARSKLWDGESKRLHLPFTGF